MRVFRSARGFSPSTIGTRIRPPDCPSRRLIVDLNTVSLLAGSGVPLLKSHSTSLFASAIPMEWISGGSVITWPTVYVMRSGVTSSVVPSGSNSSIRYLFRMPFSAHSSVVNTPLASRLIFPLRHGGVESSLINSIV